MNEKILLLNDKNFRSEVNDFKGFVLVDFWAEWCNPCKIMMIQIEKLLKDKKENLKICKFDIDDGNEIPSKYGIQSIPTIIIFQDGKEIIRKIGIVDDLLSFVNNTINC